MNDPSCFICAPHGSRIASSIRKLLFKYAYKAVNTIGYDKINILKILVDMGSALVLNE